MRQTVFLYYYFKLLPDLIEAMLAELLEEICI